MGLKDKLNNLKKKVEETDALDKVMPFVEKAGEVASDISEKTRPVADKAGEVASGIGEKAKPVAEKIGDGASLVGVIAKDAFSGAAENAKDKAKEIQETRKKKPTTSSFIDFLLPVTYTEATKPDAERKKEKADKPKNG